MKLSSFEIKVAAEDALILYVDEPLAAANDWVRQIDAALTAKLGELLIETTPSYASLLIRFNPFAIDHYQLRRKLKSELNNLVASRESNTLDRSRVIELPVYYSQETGPDLERVAQHAGLSVEQVINLHLGQQYQVFAIGFAPGFAYLGEVDEQLSTPRLSTPRTQVAKGSVAIADRQTAIYPASSPGGWNIIGRCPLTLFDPSSTPSSPYQVGDKVKFVAIDKRQFIELGGEL